MLLKASLTAISVDVSYIDKWIRNIRRIPTEATCIVVSSTPIHWRESTIIDDRPLCRSPIIRTIGGTFLDFDVPETANLPEHLSSPLDFSWIHVTRSLVWCVCFVDSCVSFCPFWPLCCLFFDLRILITPLVSSSSSYILSSLPVLILFFRNSIYISYVM